MRRTIAVVAGIAVTLAGLGYAGLRLGAWLSVADPVRTADVVVVPAGDPDRRLVRALDLLDRGVASRLWVVVGEVGPVLEETGAVREFVAERGYTDELRIIGESDSTRDDARLTRNAARREGLHRPTIGLVTSPWRLTRARATFERVLGDRVEVLAWPDGSAYDADRWWEEHGSDTVIEAAKLVSTMALVRPTAAPGTGDIDAGMAARALLGGLLGALVAGALVRPTARRLRLVARPRLFRVSPRPTPLMGGAAILVGMGIGVVVAGGVEVGSIGIVAVGGVAVLALVGLVDDLAGLGPRSRLFWAAAAGGAAWLFGLRASVFPSGSPPGDVADALVTLAWFVGVTHALNILDHVDGAAAGVAAVSAAWIAVIAAAGGQVVVAVGAAALVGASLGYLFHNFPPARLFMGDMGALGIGFALAALAMALEPEQPPPLSMVVAVLVVGVPLFDVALVTVSRLRLRHRVSVGGTDHTTHRLIARGLSVRRAAAFLWGCQLVLGALALGVALAPRAWAWALVTVVATGGTVALIAFLRLPVWETAAPSASPEVIEGIEGALRALSSFSEAAAADGLTSSDPATARAVRDTVRRLEATRRRLVRKDDPTTS